MSFATIVTAMILFGVIHSLLAGHDVKQWARRRWGDRAYEGFYRLAYNLFGALSVAPVLALLLLLPGGVVWQVTDPALALALRAVQLVGVIGLAVALLQVDLGRFGGLTQAVAYVRGEPLPLAEEPLQTRGLYALVRHPLYLFSLLVLWPMPVMMEGWLAFAVGSTLYFVVGSRFEEKRLRRVFGEEYRRYQARVPWLIPRVRFGRSSASPENGG